MIACVAVAAIATAIADVVVVVVVDVVCLVVYTIYMKIPLNVYYTQNIRNFIRVECHTKDAGRAAPDPTNVARVEIARVSECVW